MNDVIIGTDNREPNITIVGINYYDSDTFQISYYGKYFKISHPWFKSDLLIFDNCNEYNELIDYVNNQNPRELEEFLVPLFIRNTTSDGIIDTLCHVARQGFIEGKMKVQNDMRKILGLK